MAENAAEKLFMAEGFGALRQRILSIAQAAGGTPLEVYDAVIDFAHKKRAEARAAGNTPREILDQADLDLRALKAVRELWRELSRIDESRAAREKLLGPVS